MLNTNAKMNMFDYLGSRPVETSIVGLFITLSSKVLYNVTYILPQTIIELEYIKDWVYIISAGLGGVLSLLGIIGWFLKNVKKNNK